MKKVYLSILTMALFSGCSTQTLSTPTQAAAALSKPTSSIVPTNSFIFPTATLTPDLPYKTNISTWYGVPIMPGAIKVSDNESNYFYKTDASVDDVIIFYLVEANTNHWSLFSYLKDTPTYQGRATVLGFDFGNNNGVSIDIYNKKEENIRMIRLLRASKGG